TTSPSSATTSWAIARSSPIPRVTAPAARAGATCRAPTGSPPTTSGPGSAARATPREEAKHAYLHSRGRGARRRRLHGPGRDRRDQRRRRLAQGRRLLVRAAVADGHPQRRLHLRRALL